MLKIEYAIHFLNNDALYLLKINFQLSVHLHPFLHEPKVAGYLKTSSMLHVGDIENT
jgi:hypothetical protein